MSSSFAVIDLSIDGLTSMARRASAARISLQECDAGHAGRRIRRLLLRTSRMLRCLNVAMILFVSAMVGLAVPFSDRVFLVAGHRVLRGAAVMLRPC